MLTKDLLYFPDTCFISHQFTVQTYYVCMYSNNIKKGVNFILLKHLSYLNILYSHFTSNGKLHGLLWWFLVSLSFSMSAYRCLPVNLSRQVTPHAIQMHAPFRLGLPYHLEPVVRFKQSITTCSTTYAKFLGKTRQSGFPEHIPVQLSHHIKYLQPHAEYALWSCLFTASVKWFYSLMFNYKCKLTPEG